MENKEWHRKTALTEWQAQIRRLRILLARADELTPSGFVKQLHEALPELRQIAMEAVIYLYVTDGQKERRHEELRQPR